MKSDKEARTERVYETIIVSLIAGIAACAIGAVTGGFVSMVANWVGSTDPNMAITIGAYAGATVGYLGTFCMLVD